MFYQPRVLRKPMKTKGEVEAQISQAMVQFEIDYMGRGPKEARSYVIDDMVIVRLKGVLTPAEQQLSKTAEGRELVKKMRATLIEKARPLLFQVIGDITGATVDHLYTDISTGADQRIFVFALGQELSSQLARKKGA
jgi:uncharacterized protein YbcI